MIPRHNQSAVPEFFLLGFQFQHGSRIIFFSVFLLVYISTFAGNLLIIILVSVTHHLHFPMYFFLCNLSFCDIMLSSSVVPNLLKVTLWNGSPLTVTQCLTQFHFLCFSTAAECTFLTVMSYDRYVAICKPLHYQSIMNSTLCLGLVMLSWMLGLVIALNVTFLLSQLDFCKSENIDHVFCDFIPILHASCSDTTVVQIAGFIIGAPEATIETVFIISTYVCIFLAIHRISSTTGKQKAFSTCSSHLAVVCTYYGILTTIYLFSSGKHTFNINKILSLIYTAVTPLLNPLLYSLRNREIKICIMRYWTKHKQTC